MRFDEILNAKIFRATKVLNYLMPSIKMRVVDSKRVLYEFVLQRRDEAKILPSIMRVLLSHEA